MHVYSQFETLMDYLDSYSQKRFPSSSQNINVCKTRFNCAFKNVKSVIVLLNCGKFFKAY